jgi:EAL domain-containing protein (putative c-di-GMP-specific phosphodiesterase class I)
VLGALSGEALHRYDLHSKVAALAIAQQLGNQARLSLNLLPESLLVDAGAVDFLVRAGAAHGFTPDRMVLEVTEEEAITDLDMFADAVKRVRAAGMHMAIDDFGAGFAGLSLLADFQPDKLKIDRCIVQNVHESGPRQAIVRAIVEFCYCLGISVVAEGVETREEFEWLRSAGVHRIQGYLLARPQLCALPPVCWQV